MDKRETCDNAFMDAMWGEYKCKAKERVIYDKRDCIGCRDYRRKKRGADKQ